MRKASIAATVVLVLVAGAFVGTRLAAARRPPVPHHYIAVMTPTQQNTASVQTAPGGTLYASLIKGNFCWHFNYHDLSEVPNIAHFHSGAAGETGAPYFDIEPDVPPLTGCKTAVELRQISKEADLPDFIARLNANKLYFNVHTPTNNPTGEVRGQVLRTK